VKLKNIAKCKLQIAKLKIASELLPKADLHFAICNPFPSSYRQTSDNVNAHSRYGNATELKNSRKASRWLLTKSGFPCILKNQTLPSRSTIATKIAR